MKKIIALAILALALLAGGSAAVVESVQPQHVVACAAYGC